MYSSSITQNGRRQTGTMLKKNVEVAFFLSVFIRGHFAFFTVRYRFATEKHSKASRLQSQ